MREIKFRAWDSTRNNMNYKVCVGNTDFSDENYTCSTILVNGEWLHFDDYHKIVTMQYTGLKDKNGVEIYERDVVRVSEFKKLQLVSNISGMQFELNSLPSNDDWSPLKDSALSSIEVIGNIYEDPELLAEEQ